MTLYPQLIIDALKTVRYPGTGQDIVSAGMVGEDIRIDGMKVSFSLITEKANDPFIKSLVKMAEQAILTRLFETPAGLRLGLPGCETEWARLEAALSRL